MARSGGQPEWSGPRLPRHQEPRQKLVRGVEPLAHEPEDAADPGNGEPLPRCWTCGVPGLAGNRLMDFALVYRGKRAGTWRLCERCWLQRNPPERADPLDVTDAA